MTPLEINKKIAGLKCGIGERGVSASIGDYGRPTNRVTYFLEADDNVRVHSRFFNWAETITDAWELFEELPNPKLQLFNRDDAGLVRFPWRCTVDFNKDYEFMGETAPLAIAKAWLAWKENKK